MTIHRELSLWDCQWNSSDLTWHANAEMLVQKAYQRMIMLQKLYSFNLGTELEVSKVRYDISLLHRRRRLIMNGYGSQPVRLSLEIYILTITQPWKSSILILWQTEDTQYLLNLPRNAWSTNKQGICSHWTVVIILMSEIKVPSPVRKMIKTAKDWYTTT